MSKRLFDLFFALLGLVLLAPFFAVIAIAIKWDSPGPIFFRGVRVGKDGHPFRIFKFRTMIADAARRGPGITTHSDARITRIGRVLRDFKLDELPQLINVIHGEMSLVGPRPEDPAYIEYYTPQQRQVLSVRPGITSPASLYFRHEERLLQGSDWQKVYLEDLMPRKLALELDYIQHGNILTDIGLVVRTVLAMIK